MANEKRTQRLTMNMLLDIEKPTNLLANEKRIYLLANDNLLANYENRTYWLTIN